MSLMYKISDEARITCHLEIRVTLKTSLNNVPQNNQVFVIHGQHTRLSMSLHHLYFPHKITFHIYFIHLFRFIFVVVSCLSICLGQPFAKLTPRPVLFLLNIPAFIFKKERRESFCASIHDFGIKRTFYFKTVGWWSF